MKYPLSADYSTTTTVSYKLDYGDEIVVIPESKTVDLDDYQPLYDDLYLIASPSGVCALVPANSDEEALEKAADKNLLLQFILAADDDKTDDSCYLDGNWYDLTYCRVQKIASMDVVATLKL